MMDIEELKKRLRMMRNAAATGAADALSQLQAENKELAAFVIACGGFWENSKSKLLGDESLHAVIESAFSGAAEAEKLQAENAELRRELEEARKDAATEIVSIAESKGWGMRNDEPFEDSVREVCDEFLRTARQQQGDDAKG